MQHLQPNTTLQGGKYRIERVLGQGGFGITYLAIQAGLERNVAIKEFFMKELCVRDESTSHVTLGTEGSREMVSRFREKFLKEARNIAKLNHPNIVRIIDVFEENGTAYYVMEYAEGGSLATKIDSEGCLSEPVATHYILQVANALDYIHQKKMNHLDVKPANIMLNEKDEVVLIDFGLSKQYDGTTGKQTSTTPVGISEGYAPMEQYKQGGVGTFSPETDIYSLGATFFKMLTGITPPSASDINEDGVPIETLKAKGISQTTIDVICKAMEGRKKDRLKDVRTFIDTLNGKVNSPSSKSVTPLGKPKTIEPPTPIPLDDETIVGNIVKPDPKPTPTPTPAPKPEPPKSTATSNDDDNNSGAKFWIIFLLSVGIVLLILFNLDNCTGTSSGGEYIDTLVADTVEDVDTIVVDTIIDDLTNKRESDLVRLIVNQVGKYPYESGLSENKEFIQRFSALIGSKRYSSFKKNNILEVPIKEYDNFGRYAVWFFDKDEQYVYYIIYDKPKDNLTVIMAENGVNMSIDDYAQEKSDINLITTFNEEAFH